ncbi:MAG: FxsB family cyclophane-forming radical SAM/SPASM peptide maturase [Streptosporangiaceae bacterium]
MTRPSIPPRQTGPPRLSQVILKLHSRCDLACDHCYVYEAVDQSWRGRPVVISDEVMSQAAGRIADYASSHALPGVQVVLHGGEPLLAGPARLRRVITELQKRLRGVCRLDLRIHTNGVVLNKQLCELFAEHGVKVGISIDGDRAANDRHRRYADGRSSYDKVIRAIGLLRSASFRDLYSGLLCTIDTANDPLVVYESLMDLGPPRIDFLLPHATWDHPPRRTPASDCEYADWLIAIFDRWLADGRPTRIRTFDSIISTLRGGESFTEALGLGPVSLVVIETDGSYEQVDSLKAAFEGAPETGMNVFEHAIDVVGQHPGIVARQQGMAALSQTCQECPVVSSCGGGLYTHRYREGSGFANPSVYCPDLFKLISHISSYLPEEAGGRPTHAISGPSFEALAAGFGDAAAVTSLIEAERSLARGLLGAVYQAGIAAPVITAEDKAELRGAWSRLATFDREQPEALNATLGHPYLRTWAVHCLEELRLAPAWDDQGRAGNAQNLAVDLGLLGAVTAACAARAGMGAAVTVPVMDAAVHLPTLGRLVLGPEHGAWPAAGERETARISVISNAVIIRVGESCWTLDRTALLDGVPSADAVSGNSRSGEWQPVRMLRAGGCCVALDDTDPYRDCVQWPIAPRLTDAEAAQWEREFQLAWQEIEHDHPTYAPGLAAGLTTLTPLTAAHDNREVSATARHAFGAVAVSAPSGPARLALLLIQEFQHVKLGAMLDLYDLYDPADDRLFHAPWGEGKRQLEGLLQGAYAQLAVTDVWRVRQQRAVGPAAEAAGRRFQECRALTGEGIETLLGSGSLTSLGTRFVQEMRRSVSAFTGPAGIGDRR